MNVNYTDIKKKYKKIINLIVFLISKINKNEFNAKTNKIETED